MKNIVVVNASFFGDERNEMKVIDQPDCGVDYIMYTNKPELTEGTIWEPVHIEIEDNMRLKAREIKSNIHNILPDYEHWLWMDTCMKLNVNPNDLVSHYLGDIYDLCVTPHPERFNIIQEGNELLFQMSKDGHTMSDQINQECIQGLVNRYYNEGYVPTSLYATGCLLRRNTERVRKFNEIWWKEIQGCVRDQMSFTYSAWKVGLAINSFPGSNFHSLLRQQTKPYLSNWDEIELMDLSKNSG